MAMFNSYVSLPRYGDVEIFAHIVVGCLGKYSKRQVFFLDGFSGVLRFARISLVSKRIITPHNWDIPRYTPVTNIYKNT
jgi:hypothetical protein